MGRVILPVYADGLQMVQMRAVYAGQSPKYVNTASAETTAFYSDDALFIGEPLQGTVITEDICSCVRVGRLIKSFSTLGTNLSNKLAVQACTALHYVPIGKSYAETSSLP